MALKDSSRSGQSHLVFTPSITDAVDSAVRNGRQRTVEDIRLMFRISHGNAHAIFTEQMKYRKICAQWGPQSLTEEQKCNRMLTSLHHLERYHVE